MFKAPTSPIAATRAEQAAVLYDELIFETGLYEVATTPNGSSDDWTPQEHITPEVLTRARDTPEPGASMSILVGVNLSKA
jgi:hypothetical protein